MKKPSPLKGKVKPVKAWAIMSKKGIMFEFGRTREEAWENYARRYWGSDVGGYYAQLQATKLGCRCIRVLITPL